MSEFSNQLLIALRALKNADDAITASNEYLRDELRTLLTGADELLEKMKLEHLLIEAREVLHALHHE